MFIELCKISKFVMHLNSCFMDLGCDNFLNFWFPVVKLSDDKKHVMGDVFWCDMIGFGDQMIFSYSFDCWSKFDQLGVFLVIWALNS